MGFMWLSFGMAGVLEACGIAFAAGLVVSLVAHRLGRAIGWKQGTGIGVALVVTLAVAAGVDAWDLFHLSIVRLESPYVIMRTLETIHDPDYLGTRVVFEFAGTVAGVMLGWYLSLARPKAGG
jgi:hypothetical protein